MTVTHVDGVEVVANVDTLSPLSKNTNAPIYWTQVRTLHLADGSTAFGCDKCDQIFDRATQVRPHLNSHRKDKRVTGTRIAGTASSDRQAMKKKISRLERSRDDWRSRAMAAERSLAAMKVALGVPS